VKHGVPISITNVYDSEVGNPQLPKKLQAIKKHQTRVRSAQVAIALLVLAAIATGSVFLVRRPTRSASAIVEKSIAVMPFQNLSRDPDNAYFADGIQEEILTRLAKIADLKVISRASTQRYQSKPGNLSEIATQLGVANILEGSVQKAGNQVRVNVHLINAQTGSQLWAETYDRKLSDIFAVESDIAKGIAESLQATLTGGEEQALAANPTNNQEAYDAYLHGLAFEARANYSSDALFKAIGYYGLAVQLDPTLRLPGRGFPVRTRFFTLTATIQQPLAATRLKKLWSTRKDYSRTHPKPFFSWVIINIGCCTITGWPRLPSHV
jgi:TolB-like protein